MQKMKLLGITSLLLSAPLAHAENGSSPQLHCEPTELANYPMDAHAQLSSSEEGLILSVTDNMYGLRDTVSYRVVLAKSAGKNVYTATEMLNARSGANPSWIRESVATLRLEVTNSGSRGLLNIYDSSGPITGLKMSCAPGAETNPNFQPGEQ